MLLSAILADVLARVASPPMASLALARQRAAVLSHADIALQLKELIQRKDALVAARATPPYILKADLRTLPLNVETFGTKFDVVCGICCRGQVGCWGYLGKGVASGILKRWAGPHHSEVGRFP